MEVSTEYKIRAIDKRYEAYKDAFRKIDYDEKTDTWRDLE